MRSVFGFGMAWWRRVPSLVRLVMAGEAVGILLLTSWLYAEYLNNRFMASYVNAFLGSGLGAGLVIGSSVVAAGVFVVLMLRWNARVATGQLSTKERRTPRVPSISRQRVGTGDRGLGDSSVRSIAVASARSGLVETRSPVGVVPLADESTAVSGVSKGLGSRPGVEEDLVQEEAVPGRTRVFYDDHEDALHLVVKDVPVVKTEELDEVVTVGRDTDGAIVIITIANARRNVAKPLADHIAEQLHASIKRDQS